MGAVDRQKNGSNPGESGDRLVAAGARPSTWLRASEMFDQRADLNAPVSSVQKMCGLPSQDLPGMIWRPLLS